jgi:DNA-binding CsgD family transcriptional regulator
MVVASPVGVITGGTRTVPIVQLGEALPVLLSPLNQDVHAWRREVTRTMRALMEADRAVLLLFRERPPVVNGNALSRKTSDEYVEPFAPLDGGLARRDGLKLTLWSRRLLWRQDKLFGSTDSTELTCRQDLRDALGGSLDLDIEGIRARLRLILLYGHAPLSADRADELLARLGLILPALRTGFGMHLRLERWLLNVPSMLDKIGQRLVLFTVAGREIYRTAVMRRTLAEDPEHERIEAALEAVARGTAHMPLGNNRPEHARLLRDDLTRREIRTSTACYHLRGSLMGPDTVGPEPTVLVSMDHLVTEPPSAVTLRGRFGLTVREVQVACLLVQRLTNAEIASALGISSHTARHHTESVLMKVGVNTRQALRRILS